MNPAARSKDRNESALQGARKLLTECLELKTHDVLALFWDETTADTAEVLLAGARELGLNVRPRNVPLAEQSSFSANAGLSLEDREALDDARGIITCLSNQVAGTAYRTELVRVGTDGGKRFGHMPGANLSVLANSMNIDYELASSRCDDLALAMTLGQTVRLQTYIPGVDGGPETACDLNFQIGGLLRSPITSTGIIPLGTWGNLPGGETFIAPIEDTANGIFVLNGAFKNYIIKPPAYLLLHFEGGRLVRIEGTPDEERAFNSILDFARDRGDAYYDALAELGIGVNPGIQELTGNALFDEKCYGTAHIAIGDSSRYGGLYSSRIHEDLISRQPSLWIDDKPILDKGKDSFEAHQWRETLDEVVIGCEPLDPDCVVARTIIAAEKGDQGRLWVRRRVAAGRVGSYHIGEDATSQLLAHLYAMVPPLGRRIKLDELCRKSGEEMKLSRDLTTAAINILVQHGVITVRVLENEQGESHHE